MRLAACWQSQCCNQGEACHCFFCLHDCFQVSSLYPCKDKENFPFESLCKPFISVNLCKLMLFCHFLLSHQSFYDRKDIPLWLPIYQLMDNGKRNGQGMKAIIIGATSGIGMEVARTLHSDGWTVGLAGRRAERLDALCKEMGERAVAAAIDVTSDDATQRLNSLIDMAGGADLIFIAAGIGWQNASLDTDKELATAETNVMGFTRMANAAYHYFEKQGRGHIACISSIAGTKGLGAAPAYSATKRYQNTYVQCLAQLAHMNKLGIRFTDIRPGFVDTALISGSHFPMTMRPERTARLIVKALYAKRRKVVVDWRYGVLVALWSLIPDWLWERLNIR